jgi:polynucleotide 5'-hydroxyl-kinase GRC3/NOL9
MRAELVLEEGSIARLYGPARVRVASGQVMVLGAIYEAGSEFYVHPVRSYGVKALVESRLVVELGSGGSVEKPSPGEEPLDRWVYLVDHALRRGCRGFIVLGPTDAGKSSMAALVSNRALLRGLQPGLVDADVGQADIGPPAFVSAARPRGFVLWLRELWPEKMRFIGYITPARNERRIVAAVVDLARWLRSAGSDVVVVDTDGWVQGVQSLEYKLEAAHYAGLDTVLVVGDEKLYRMVARAWGRRGCGVVYLPSPSQKRSRERGDRRSLRSEAYRRFLGNAAPRRLDLSGLTILGSCFYMGDRLSAETAAGFSSVLRTRVLAASETYDTIYVVTAGQADPAGIEKLSEAMDKQVYILDINNMKGALVALLGPGGEEAALGILDSIDPAADRATILTSYRGEVTGIIVGGTRLGPGLEEQGRPLRCVI